MQKTNQDGMDVKNGQYEKIIIIDDSPNVWLSDNENKR